MKAVYQRPGDRTALARYEQLVELAPDGILIHADGLIVLANAAAMRLAGATRRDQLIGTPIEALLDPPYLKAAQDLLTLSDVTDPSHPVRDVLHRLDGTDRQVEVRAVAFMDRGVPSAHLIIRDITDRIAADAAARGMDARLRQAQRMETIGAIAGGVAHEINNMLQVMLGFSGLVLTNPLFPRDCLADLRQVMQAGERAAAITAQLLAYGRRALHRPEYVDLTAAVRETEPMLRRALLPGQQLEIHGSAPVPALIDTEQMRQVLLNLVMNAAAAMPPDGVVSISSGSIGLSTPLAAADGSTIHPGRYVALHVRDSGAGIDAAILPRIFEPFFTTRGHGQGTGLGLSAVLGIVQQHRGYIVVSSAPGQGTAFSVYLPIPVAMASHQTIPVTDPAPLRQPADDSVVLVVDDEPGIRALAARILEEAGYQVHTAGNGRQALEAIVLRGCPALVLTDVIMPGINGVELAERLVLRWPALPVLFMSGYSTEALQQLMHLDSAVALLQKPFTKEELLLQVAEAVAGGRRAGVQTS